MLCLAALHGMVALVGSEGDVMQVKKKGGGGGGGRNLNVYIVTARKEYPISQYAKERTIYDHGIVYTGLSNAFIYGKLLLVRNSFHRGMFLILFGL